MLGAPVKDARGRGSMNFIENTKSKGGRRSTTYAQFVDSDAGEVGIYLTFALHHRNLETSLNEN